MAEKKKPAQTKKKPGRPSKYTPELADRICELVATNALGLDEICESDTALPGQANVRKWFYRYPDFRAKYYAAKEAQAELYAQSTLKIANERHTYIDKDGNVKVDPGAVALQKLQVNTRHWHASKLAPKKYGDKQELEVKKQENEDLKEELAKLRAELLTKHKKDV